MDERPEKSTTREVLEKVAEAGVGAVPYVGGALAMVLQYVLSAGYERRTAAWLDALALTVSRLEEREHISVEELGDNDVFLDAVVHATRAAQATHDEDKLAALRAGVLHSLGDDAPTADEQARYFRYVEQLTAAHLRLLAFLGNPPGFYKRNGLTPRSLSFGARSSLIEGLPEFQGRQEWYDLLATDLSASSLINNASLHVVMTGEGVWLPATTNLGKRFLAFITDEDNAPSAGDDGSG